MNKLIRTSLGLAACGAATLIAYASVTYSPESGGFVGKGDVQTKLGLNNAQMQANYSHVSFVYEISATYSFDCEWYTGPDHNRSHHVNSKTVVVGVPSQQVFDTKKSTSSANLTGWYLSPVSIGSSGGEPTNADCGAEGNQMKSIVEGTVELIGSSGGLSFVYKGGAPIALPNTP